jgi:RHS repeat-associated protein
VQKRSINFTAGTDTYRRYLYDGWNLVAEFSWAPSTSTLTLARSFTWGLDLAGSLTATGGVGTLLQVTEQTTGTSYFPTYDGNGNVASLLHTDGVVAAKYEYSPCGELLRSEVNSTLGQTERDALATQAFRFSTKFYDSESGLVYYGQRYYSSSLGRFINHDPIEEAGGINLYGFCGNNAIGKWDYLGQFDLPPFIVKPDPNDSSYTQWTHSRTDQEMALWKLSMGMGFGGDGGGMTITPRDNSRFSQQVQNLADAAKIRDIIQKYGGKIPNDVLWTLIKYKIDLPTYLAIRSEIMARIAAAGAGEIKAYQSPSIGEALGGFARGAWRNAWGKIGGFFSALAHPIETYRNSKIVHEPLTPYGSKIDNFMILTKMRLNSPNGCGQIVGDAAGDVAVAAITWRASVVLGETFSAFRAGLAAESTVPRTIGGIVGDAHADSMIHLTPAGADSFAGGVESGTYWARLGDVSKMTLEEYQTGVVGPGVKASLGEPVSGFVVSPPGAGSFMWEGAYNPAGIMEYTNSGLLNGTSYVPIRF